MKSTLKLKHPPERRRMTLLQQAVHDRLVKRHWTFGLLFHRAAYYRASELVTRPDGSRYRIPGSVRRPGIKVLPDGKIVCNRP